MFYLLLFMNMPESCHLCSVHPQVRTASQTTPTSLPVFVRLVHHDAGDASREDANNHHGAGEDAGIVRVVSRGDHKLFDELHNDETDRCGFTST